VDALCNQLTTAIKMNVKNIDDKKAEIINYGLKGFFSFVIKFAVMILISYFLGIINLVIISIISFGFYRTFAGGAHAKGHIRCFFSTALFIFGSVYLGKILFLYFSNAKIIYLLIFLFNCVIIYLYAPADLEQKPVRSRNMREKLRMQSAFSMGFIIVLAITAISNPIISNILVITTFMESFIMLPLSYKVFGCKYGYRDNSLSDVKPL